MSWGTKLMIGMLCFMSFIVVLGVLMFNSKTDALVDTDYYEKGLDYDKDYNRKVQVQSDNARPEIRLSADHLILSFKAAAAGELRLLRNSDKKMDRRIAINTNAQHQVGIPLSGIAKGPWRIIISWESNGKAYLYEQEVSIE
jgi:hypothetical protein